MKLKPMKQVKPKFLIFSTSLEYEVLLDEAELLSNVQKIDGERIRYSWYLMPEVRAKFYRIDTNISEITIIVRGRFGSTWALLQLENLIDHPLKLEGKVGIHPELLLAVFIVLALLGPMTIEAISRSWAGGSFMLLLISSVFAGIFIIMRDIKRFIFDVVENRLLKSNN